MRDTIIWFVSRHHKQAYVTCAGARSDEIEAQDAWLERDNVPSHNPNFTFSPFLNFLETM